MMKVLPAPSPRTASSGRFSRVAALRWSALRGLDPKGTPAAAKPCSRALKAHRHRPPSASRAAGTRTPLRSWALRLSGRHPLPVSARRHLRGVLATALRGMIHIINNTKTNKHRRLSEPRAARGVRHSPFPGGFPPLPARFPTGSWVSSTRPPKARQRG